MEILMEILLMKGPFSNPANGPFPKAAYWRRFANN